MTAPAVHAPGFWRPAGPMGILLIHGFTAAPTEMRPLADYLYERGISVRGLRLPGHGTSPEDLATCTWQQWYAAADEALAELATHCPRLAVGGLSMGGLLSAQLAARSQQPLKAAFLLAPAFYPNSRLLPLSVWLQGLLPPIRHSEEGRAYLRERGLFGYPCMPVPALAQLYRLIRATRPLLPKIKVPTHVFMGGRDGTVRPQSAYAVYHRLQMADKSLTLLPQSRHILTVEPEAPILFERIACLLSSIP